MVASARDDDITLADLLAGIDTIEDFGGSVASALGIRVQGLQLDSRKIAMGDLFLAVPGYGSGARDGRDYIEAAFGAGACAVVAERAGLSHFPIAQAPGPVIGIDNLGAEISRIAGRFYAEPSHSLKVVGCTGSNGKTTCSHLLAQLYRGLQTNAGVIGTLGYGLSGDSLKPVGLTTPDAVSCQQILSELRQRGAGLVAMEVSSHGLAQYRVEGISFHGAVFTNLSRDHLDYHGSMAEYSAAKQKLFARDELQFAVLNAEDDAAAAMASSLAPGVDCYFYTTQAAVPQSVTVADGVVVRAKQIELSPRGIRALVDSPWGQAELHSSLIGRFNLSNLLAVITSACADGLAFDEVVAAVGALRPVEGRMQLVSAGSEPAVLVDYAHTPDALEKALLSLRQIEKNGSGGRVFCVFGCGGERDAGKRTQMAAIAERYADIVVVTNDNPRGEDPARIIDDIVRDMRCRPVIIEDRAEAIRYAVNHAEESDVIMLAGKGHEQYQLVGDQRLPFSDVAQARLALARRRERQ